MANQLKVTAELYKVNFDKKAWMDALHADMVEKTKEAARSWLDTVIFRIPVWSQASRATFTELAKAVGFPLDLGDSISPFGNRRALGRSTGEGGLETNKKQGSYFFFYRTSLHYLEWNEYKTAVRGDGSGVFSQLRNPGPYHFQRAGAADFESFAANVQLVSPIRYISGKRI
jgi:hypothetical protein